LRQLKSHTGSAAVPWVRRLEVANALGNAVVKGKVALPRALEIWDEPLPPPIRQVAIGNIPELPQLAVKHDLSIYGSYLQAALVSGLPPATNERKLTVAAEASGLVTLMPWNDSARPRSRGATDRAASTGASSANLTGKGNRFSLNTLRSSACSPQSRFRRLRMPLLVFDAACDPRFRYLGLAFVAPRKHLERRVDWPEVSGKEQSLAVLF
jgi:hypothetical protein